MMTQHRRSVAFFLFLLGTVGTVGAQENAERFEKVAQQLVRAINAQDFPATRQDFSQAMLDDLTLEKSKQIFSGVASQFGKIEKLGPPQLTAPNRAVFSARCARKDMNITVVLDEHNKIDALWLKPTIPVPDRLVTSFHLPFQGEWFVAWGGDSKELNHHHDSHVERFAFDFVVVDAAGRSYEGDGKENEDYYAFGQPIRAPADGVVTDVITGVRDNTPGSVNPSFAGGNTVILGHREHEVSVLCHFQQGSIQVKRGERVLQGQVLGLCGNSGMSSEAHVHFHVQNTPLIQDATGLPCVFEKIIVTRNGKSESRMSYSPVKGDIVGQEFAWPKPAETATGHRQETEFPDEGARPPKLEDVRHPSQPSSPAVNRLDDQGFALLHRAASGGDVARVTELLESGADVNVRQAKFQGTPLQYAATWGHVDVVRVLLDHKAKIDATDIYGRTPLMWAAMKGKAKAASLVLGRGANVNAETRSGWTPLHYAVNEKHTETAQLLIDRGADLAARNSLGRTPRELSGDLELRWPPSATSGNDEDVPDAKRPTPLSDKPAESGASRANSGQGQKTPVGQTSQGPGPPVPGDAAELPAYVPMVLRWLPVDTETLVVAKEFRLPDARLQAHNSLKAVRMGRVLAVSPLPDPIKDSLSGQRVRWAVHGGRDYKVVSAFGSLRYEGASLIRFEDELSEEKLQDLHEQLRKAANDVRSVSDHDVYVFPPERGQEGKPEPWQGQYVAILNSDTMVTATSDAYLSQFLTRMATEPRDSALSADLPEWKYLDANADAWLLRHLPDQNDKIRRLLPDSERRLSGLVWKAYTEDGKPFRAVYLPLPGKNVEDVARAPWIKPNEKEIPEGLAGLLDFTTDPDGAVTMTFPREARTPSEVEQLRRLSARLDESDVKIRLLVYFVFYLGSSRGMMH